MDTRNKGYAEEVKALYVRLGNWDAVGAEMGMDRATAYNVGHEKQLIFPVIWGKRHLTVGERIKIHRTLAGISQKDLAEQAGVSEWSVRVAEQGSASFAIMVALRKALITQGETT